LFSNRFSKRKILWPVRLDPHFHLSTVYIKKNTDLVFIYLYEEGDDGMKITAAKQELAKSLNIVLKAVPSKTTMNILYCVLIDATVDTIKLTGNDMELGIETEVKGTIEERGLICLDAKLFSEIIRKMPEADITIETGSNYQTTITCENSVFNIVGKDGTEFSPLPSVDKDNPVVMNQFQLRELIRQTLFSISPNDANKIMTGENLQIHENELRMTALDGHRIAIRQLNLDSSYEDYEAIIPGKTLSEISKIVSGEIEDEVRVYFTKNQILFEMDGTLVVSRLIDGKYFRIDQMLSNDYETKINVKKTSLMSAVDRAMLFTSESDKGTLVLTIGGDSMNLSIRSSAGSMSDDVAVESEGKELRIGFNPKFILDVLRVIDDEEISVYFLNSKAPCFIRDDAGSYIYLVLPVNFV
jgi:DNA polymerase-3 subunit beta